jgi:hypothetical protein
LTAGSDAAAGVLAGAVAAPADGAMIKPLTTTPDAPTRIRERLILVVQLCVRAPTATRPNRGECPLSNCGITEYKSLNMLMIFLSAVISTAVF